MAFAKRGSAVAVLIVVLCTAVWWFGKETAKLDYAQQWNRYRSFVLIDYFDNYVSTENRALRDPVKDFSHFAETVKAIEKDPSERRESVLAFHREHFKRLEVLCDDQACTYTIHLKEEKFSFSTRLSK